MLMTSIVTDKESMRHTCKHIKKGKTKKNTCMTEKHHDFKKSKGKGTILLSMATKQRGLVLLPNINNDNVHCLKVIRSKNETKET